MGLLDDAIREHLDLKRRRGADPNEIERAEREALGPVRRVAEQPEDLEPEPFAEDDEDVDFEEPLGAYEDAAPELDEGPVGLEEAEAGGAPGVAYDHQDDPHWQDAEDERSAPEDETLIEPPSFVRPKPEATEEPPEAPPAAAPAEEPALEPEPGAPPAANEETAEYDVGQALEGEPDVLEETPEFLQDTPDHDRLWFEQRPPRDFDFDG